MVRMSLRQSERFVMLGIVGLALAGFVLLHDKAIAASTLFSPAEYANFASLSVWSVAALIVFAALRYSSALAQSASRPSLDAAKSHIGDAERHVHFHSLGQ